VGVSLRVIFGDKDEVLELLGKSTAYVERTHLTMRLFNSRLTRKTLGFSKEVVLPNNTQEGDYPILARIK
jgi:IS1 family transposase